MRCCTGPVPVALSALDCMPASVSQGPAGQSPRRVLACSALPTRSVTVTKVAAEQHPPPPSPTPQACGQGPGMEQARKAYRRCETRAGRGHSPPAQWALVAQVPVSCCLPRRGRGPLPSAPVCRLPVSWLYRVSRLMEAPLLACPYSWLLGDRRGVWPTLSPLN